LQTRTYGVRPAGPSIRIKPGVPRAARTTLKMPRRATRGLPKQKTTILFKAGNLPSTPSELFQRVFWKSDFLAGEAQNFWREVKKSEPMGLPIQAWKDWISKRGMSVGQFYNMIHGLVGAGFIEKKESRWHLSGGFLRELEKMLTVYSTESGLKSEISVA
jgi:hypothetical protein